MASVPKFYSSSDAGAPQLTGQVGSLLVVLDAILVDGYGVAGAMKPGAGWSRHLSGAGKRAYRNDAFEGTGFILEIDDSASAGNARFAIARGYSALRAFGDGEDATPSVADRPAGSIVVKSTTLGPTAARWVAIADNRAIYLFTNIAPSLLPDQRQPYFFGDFISYKPGDTMAWCIGFSGLTGYTGVEDFDSHIFSTPNSPITVDLNRPACYLPRTSNTPSSSGPAFFVGGTRVSNFHAWNAEASWLSPYPDLIAGGLLYTSVQVFERGARPRGRLPGVIVPYHAKPFADRSLQPAPLEFEGASEMAAVGYAPNYYTSPLSGEAYRGQVLLLLGGGWW